MKDPLFGNKVAAAILTTLLLAVGLPIIIGTVSSVFAGHHGLHGTEENPFDVAYMPTEVKIEGGGAVEVEEISLAVLLEAASAERGERAAGLCKACHTFEKGGANGIGPNLWNVVGREIGGLSGFGYSSAVQNTEGNWDYDKLDPYLANSQSYIPGTQMVQMVRKDNKRADILAYLQTLSDDPVPFPEVVVTEDETAEAEGDPEAETEVDAETGE